MRKFKKKNNFTLKLFFSSNFKLFKRGWKSHGGAHLLKDALMIFSVGGGNKLKKVSVNIINAINYAKSKKLKIISIVGSNNGYAYKNSDVSIANKPDYTRLITPISEALQPMVWHLLVSHPKLQENKTKW